MAKTEKSAKLTQNVYQVSGITSELAESIPEFALPVMIETTLLPFMGRIIYDGVMGTFSIHFGGGIKRELKERYMEAKKRGRIVTKL